MIVAVGIHDGLGVRASLSPASKWVEEMNGSTFTARKRWTVSRLETRAEAAKRASCFRTPKKAVQIAAPVVKNGH